MLPHSSSICDFYHFDDTKDNQRFFLIARPLWVMFKDVVCLPSPHLLFLPVFYPFSPSHHLHSTHAPLLCTLSLHLWSDYSSIDSHADVAIGRYADLAVDSHNRQRRRLQGTPDFLAVFAVCVSNKWRIHSVHLVGRKKKLNEKADNMASQQTCRTKNV